MVKINVFQIRFGLDNMDPGRQIVSHGGPVQESIGADAKNLADDPIFGVGGDLAFNWAYGNNGVRIILTGGHLSGPDVNDNNSHGLGNNIACNPLNNTVDTGGGCPYDVSYIQDCDYASKDNVCSTPRVMGNDFVKCNNIEYQAGPVYANYAIYVSMEADRFPKPGYTLSLKIVGKIEELENELSELEADIKTAEGKLESGREQLHKDIKTVEQRIEDYRHEGTWHLGMNINPADGHMFGYTVGKSRATTVNNRGVQLKITRLIYYPV